MALPLSGKKVLVTREASQAKLFSNQLHECGASVVEVPLLKIACRTDFIEKLPQPLEKFQWVFFTSVNGVRCFFEIVINKNWDLSNVKFAVVGHKTGEVLNQYGYQAEIIPSKYDGKTMVKEFLENYHNIGQVLLVQGSRSRDVIERGFEEAGVPYHTIVVYETVYNGEISEHLQQVLNTTKFDFITFTSPSTVEAFVKFSNREISNDTLIVCIGTTTEERARQLGFNNVISSDLFTIEGMIQVMCDTVMRED